MPTLNRFPHMVHEFYVDRVRAIERAAAARKAAIRTPDAARRYIDDVRTKIAACFGPLPDRTPLEPQITGVLERDSYRIEKLLIQSRPEFFVTANLYVPNGPAVRRPAVVGTCGHSKEGKAGDTYQSFAQGLARMGYVVLIYDPLGQGERLQYPNAEGGSRVGVGVNEHLYAGNQQFLVGECIGTWRAWDGIRALDYLLTRSEVDPKHVGLTGNSGGGTMTTWLVGLERRLTMAAPGCFVTTFRRNLENELPQDTEQCPPRALALGLDHDDFLAAAAPMPLILLTKEKDFFDQRGSIEAFARLKRLYTTLGRPDDVELFTGPTPHGYSKENREAMYRFFNRVTGASDAIEEPELKLESERDLWVTKGGQVAELHSRPIHFFTKATSDSLRAVRGSPRGESLKLRIGALLRLPARTAAPEYRILRALSSRGHPKKNTAVFAVESEPGVRLIIYMPHDEPWVSRPPHGDDATATVYLPHLSSDADLTAEPLVRELIEADEAGGAQFFACDLRGVGESQPDTCSPGSFRGAYGCDYFHAIHAIMLDRSVLAERVHDLLTMLDWLADHGYRRIHLAARGAGAIPATLAAVIDDRIQRVTLKNAPTSFAEIAESESYNWPLSSLLPDVLAHFDLPDCFADLAKRKNLINVDRWGPTRFEHAT